MAKMRAKENMHLATKQDGMVTIVKGASFDSSHRYVRQAPDGFVPEKDWDAQFGPVVHTAVEAATAAPGETRQVKKPAAKKPAAKKAAAKPAAKKKAAK